MGTIERRVAALEQATASREAPVVYVCVDRADETADEAVARHQSENPTVFAGARFVAVSTGIYRAPGSLGAEA
jgi:hypothetical protein